MTLPSEPSAGDPISASDAARVIRAVRPTTNIRTGAGLTISRSDTAILLSLVDQQAKFLLPAFITSAPAGDDIPIESAVYGYRIRGYTGEETDTNRAPRYGRVFASGVRVKPALVGDLCYVVRLPNGDGGLTDDLWILTEQVIARRCGTPPPGPPAPPPPPPPEPPAGIVISPVEPTTPDTTTMPPPLPIGIFPSPLSPSTSDPGTGSPSPFGIPATAGVPNPPQRFETVETGFSLALASNHVDFAVPEAIALRVSADVETGTWANAALEVKFLTAAGQAKSFASAKTIAAGGGAGVLISDDEMRGVTRIRIEKDSSTDASTWLMLTITADAGDTGRNPVAAKS